MWARVFPGNPVETNNDRTSSPDTKFLPSLSAWRNIPSNSFWSSELTTQGGDVLEAPVVRMEPLLVVRGEINDGREVVEESIVGLPIDVDLERALFEASWLRN